MHNWRNIFIQLASAADGRLDTLKRALEERWGDAPTSIVAYHSYGTGDCLMLNGRVLEDRGIQPAGQTDSAWHNLRTMYRRFNSDAIPNAQLLARFGAVERTVIADDEDSLRRGSFPTYHYRTTGSSIRSCSGCSNHGRPDRAT